MEQRKANAHVTMKMPKAHSEPVIDLLKAKVRPVVLDGPTLDEVKVDMANTILPSWMANGPPNLGSAGSGKLSADQWRTVCSVNLVITMIRLWGHPEATARETALLGNFLALVIMVRWATKRSTSEEHLKILEDNLQYYLKSLVELFSEDALYPNHHLSLHLPECIRNFGPVHGWWAFPFERYNGIIQRFNTNNKMGNHCLSLYLKIFPFTHSRKGNSR